MRYVRARARAPSNPHGHKVKPRNTPRAGRLVWAMAGVQMRELSSQRSRRVAYAWEPAVCMVASRLSALANPVRHHAPPVPATLPHSLQEPSEQRAHDWHPFAGFAYGGALCPADPLSIMRFRLAPTLPCLCSVSPRLASPVPTLRACTRTSISFPIPPPISLLPHLPTPILILTCINPSIR